MGENCSMNEQQAHSISFCSFAREWFRLGPATVLVVIWAAIITIVWRANLDYEFTPARNAQPPSHWPVDSRLSRGNGPALIVFLHAYCPCSNATLHELAKLLTHLPVGGHAFCVISYPQARESSESDLEISARQIPNLQVTVDHEPEQTTLFGATASGTVLFYDADGKLLFSGGITPSRGHEGANPGVDFLLASFRGERGPTTTMPVFGCGLALRSQPSPTTNLPREEIH